MDTPRVEKGVAPDEEGIGPLAPKTCEGRIDLAAGAGVEHLDLQPNSASCGLHVAQCGLGIYSIDRIDEHGQTSRSGHQFTQQFQPLCHQLSTEKIYSCQVATRLGEASHQTNPDRIFGDDEDDRNGALASWPDEAALTAMPARAARAQELPIVTWTSTGTILQRNEARA